MAADQSSYFDAPQPNPLPRRAPEERPSSTGFAGEGAMDRRFGAAATTRFRPSRLAWYSAASARLSNARGLAPQDAWAATPMLSVIRGATPSLSKRFAAQAARTISAISMASAKLAPGNRIA